MPTKLWKKTLLVSVALTTAACSLSGEPSDTEISRIARQEVARSFALNSHMEDVSKQELQKAFDEGRYEKRGNCDLAGEVYICAVDITTLLPNQIAVTTRTVTLHVRKGRSGWEATDQDF